jgi:hypothetical protein
MKDLAGPANVGGTFSRAGTINRVS